MSAAEAIADFRRARETDAFVWGRWDCLAMARDWLDWFKPGRGEPLAAWMDGIGYARRVQSEADFKRFLVEERLTTPARFAVNARRLGYRLRCDGGRIGDVALDADLRFGIVCEPGSAALFLAPSRAGLRVLRPAAGAMLAFEVA